jgi:hypothetical protein
MFRSFLWGSKPNLSPQNTHNEEEAHLLGEESFDRSSDEEYEEELILVIDDGSEEPEEILIAKEPKHDKDKSLQEKIGECIALLEKLQDEMPAKVCKLR